MPVATANTVMVARINSKVFTGKPADMANSRSNDIVLNALKNKALTLKIRPAAAPNTSTSCRVSEAALPKRNLSKPA